jgi:RNA polymerase sigma-70 factor (ECF subfamily)
LRRIPPRTQSLDDIAEPADARVFDEGLEDRDRDLVIRRALVALPGKYREVLILFYFHEMDVAAAALSLGLPEGTIKARLFRGREILRSKLPQMLAAPRLKEA